MTEAPPTERIQKDEERLCALQVLLENHDRIAVVGGPKTGKTTLTTIVSDRPVIHTDDVRVEWAAIPAALISRLRGREKFVLEGVQAARALRAGLPIDAVLYLDDAVVPQSKGQASMSKAIETIFLEWRSRNADIEVMSPDRVR